MEEKEVKLEDGRVVGKADALRWILHAENVLSRLPSRDGNRPKVAEIDEAREGLEWARTWVDSRQE
jgi:hypothetical protein